MVPSILVKNLLVTDIWPMHNVWPAQEWPVYIWTPQFVEKGNLQTWFHFLWSKPFGNRHLAYAQYLVDRVSHLIDKSRLITNFSVGQNVFRQNVIRPKDVLPP
jgi:hypothetical protein